MSANSNYSEINRKAIVADNENNTDCPTVIMQGVWALLTCMWSFFLKIAVIMG